MERGHPTLQEVRLDLLCLLDLPAGELPVVHQTQEAMIPLLNQPDPDAPIDGAALAREFQAGLETCLDVPLSQTHLACLALAAQRTLYQADCSGPVREVLLTFLGWCSQHAEFGTETRKLLAEQGEHFRRLATTEAHGVQAPGREDA